MCRHHHVFFGTPPKSISRDTSLIIGPTLPNINIRDPIHDKNLPIMSVTGSINQNVFKFYLLRLPPYNPLAIHLLQKNWDSHFIRSILVKIFIQKDHGKRWYLAKVPFFFFLLKIETTWLENFLC